MLLTASSLSAAACAAASELGALALSGHLVRALGGAVPKGGVTVDVDLTFLWPILVFVVLIVVLKPTLFDPMLKLFEERERRIDGAKLAARRMDESSAAALTKYDGEMKKARSAGNADREVRRAEGLKEEGQLVGAMREKTAGIVASGRKAIHDEADQARAGLSADAGAIANALASRVLGREVQG